VTPPNVPHNRPAIEDADIASVSAVLRSGFIAQGREVRAFEEEIAARFGRPGGDAVAVTNGTAALYLSLRVLGIGIARRVLVPSYVCTALVHAVRLAGAAPVIGDIDDDDFNLVAESAGTADAIIVPHTYGMPADIARFRDAGVPVIEDAAQAFGARFGTQPAGSLGDLSISSFYATKPLTAGGGGILLGPKEACEAARDVRDYDGKPVLRERFNLQMTDLQAALGRSQLRRFDAMLARRAETAAIYRRALPASIRTQEPRRGAQPNHFRFVVRLRQVEGAGARFAAAGIDTIVPTEPWELLHRQLGLAVEKYPRAEHVAATTLSVPIYPSLSDEGRQRVAAVLATLEDLA
jgi:perosamine synthetase